MEQVIYKTVGSVELKLHIAKPSTGVGSAIIFFFGGGWVGGNPAQFYPHCEHFSKLGMLAISAEYRVRDRHGTTPFECVADGQSAIRWLREHATELGIDPQRIVAGGGSAGGHVAACTALLGDVHPNALVLFNPVLNATEPRLADRFNGRAAELSPTHHVKSDAPPTIIFHGTADETVPIETIEHFTQLMIAAGNRCELVKFPGKGHAFFNYGRDNNEPYNETVAAADRFLTELGFLR